MRGQVLGLRAVDQVRRLAGECLRAEGVLGVEVRRGQVQAAALGVLDGEREHLLRVARTHPGVDDQDGVACRR